MSQPLVSIVMFGRNDNYTPDFLYRLSTTINFLAQGAKQKERLHELEILIVDWASEQKLKDHVQLTDEGAQITKFIYVPKTFTDNYYQDIFTANLCANIGLKRARGELVAFCGAEVLIPAHSIAAMCDIAAGRSAISKANEKLYVCGRYRIPAQWVISQPNIEQWQRYLENNSWRIKQELGRGSFLTGNAGLFLIPKKILETSRGLLESLDPYWGWNDVEYTSRILTKYPCIDLNSNGVSVYDMEHFEQSGERPQAIKKTPPRILHQSFSANDKNWGAGNIDFVSEQSTSLIADGFKETAKGLFPSISDDRLLEFAIWMADNLAELPKSQEVMLLVALFNHYKAHNILFYKEYGINQGHSFYLFSCLYQYCHLVGIDHWTMGAGEYGVDHIAYNLTTPVMNHLGHLRLVNSNLLENPANSLAAMENDHRDGVVLYRVNDATIDEALFATLENDLQHHYVILVGKNVERYLTAKDMHFEEVVKGYAYSINHSFTKVDTATQVEQVNLLINQATNVANVTMPTLLNSLDNSQHIVLWGNNELSRLITAYCRDKHVDNVASITQVAAAIKDDKTRVLRTF